MGIQEHDRPWYCHSRFTYSCAFIVSGLLWWAIIAGGIWLWRHLGTIAASVWADVWANVCWLWDAGPVDDPWLGPGKYMLVAGIVCVIWFLGVGAVEWWNRRR